MKRAIALIVLGLAILAPSAGANVYMVGPNSSMHKLSDATSVAGVNDAVLIEAGTYPERLEITKGGGYIGAGNVSIPVVVVRSSHTVVMRLSSCFVVGATMPSEWLQDVTLMGDSMSECRYDQEYHSGWERIVNGVTVP